MQIVFFAGFAMSLLQLSLLVFHKRFAKPKRSGTTGRKSIDYRLAAMILFQREERESRVLPRDFLLATGGTW